MHRTPDGFLSVVVLSQERTNNAVVYSVGVLGGNGNVTPIGKTDPQRRLTAENGEIIRISVAAVSRREDNGIVRYGISKPTPVKSKIIPDRPSSLQDVERLFDKGQSA